MTDSRRLHPPANQKALEDARPDEDAEYVQYQDGDGATGANKAYGNSAGNTGARFNAPEP